MDSVDEVDEVDGEAASIALLVHSSTSSTRSTTGQCALVRQANRERIGQGRLVDEVGLVDGVDRTDLFLARTR